MATNETSNTIQAVINTLNLITVSGKQNMDRLLGSIVALEGVIKQLEVVKEAQEE